MREPEIKKSSHSGTPPSQADLPAPALLGDREMTEAFGEDPESFLDTATWVPGPALERKVLQRFQEEVDTAVKNEDGAHAVLRAEGLAGLGIELPDVPEIGLYRTLPDELTVVREGLLFPGDVEAVHGRMVEYRTLPVGFIQFGIAAVSYRGATATFSQRLFHKELANRPLAGADELMQALRRVFAREPSAEDLPALARRAIQSHAERAILTDVCRAEWRLGYGTPCPWELLTGSFQMRLLRSSLDVLRRLIGEHQKFVFVAGPPTDTLRLRIGHALRPGEFAIVDSLRARCVQMVESGHYAEADGKAARAFAEEYGGQVLAGIFRASALAPPQLFYAHRKHFFAAAWVALADSLLRPERGFPLLLDVADLSCRGVFGEEGLSGLAQDAYVRTEGGLQYIGVAAR